MVLGAVIDAGARVSEINQALAKLDASGFSLRSERGRRGGVNGTLATVDLNEEARRPRRIDDFLNIV